MLIQNIKKELSLIFRGYRLLYSIDKDLIIYRSLESLIKILAPYSTIYLSALLINGITQHFDFYLLLRYALAIVIINLVINVAQKFVARKANISDTLIWYSNQAMFNSANMQMQYEHLENPQTHLLRDRILEAENASGYGLLYLAQQIDKIITAIFSIIFSTALTITLFSSRADGQFTGIQAIVNSPLSCLFIFLLLGLTIFINVTSIKKRDRISNSEIQNLASDNRLARYYFKLLGNYHAAAEIRIFNQQPLIDQEWLARMQNPVYMDNIIKAERIAGRVQSFVSFLLNIPLYLYIALKAYMGAFLVGNFMLYTGTVSRFVSAVTDLCCIFSLLQNNNRYMQDIFTYIDMPNRMYQGTLPVEKRAFCDDGDNAYEIEFRDVSFRYPASDTYALRHVNVKFHIGERVAIVGMNGSGKTTFIKLLCRLYDPTEGQILLNGIDIRKYQYEEYLSIFSVVFQDFYLFSFPLGQNVAASLEYDQARVLSSLKEIGFDLRLQKMPQGLDTCLYKNFDANGVEVSGGEAQKIAIARALYKDAPFIVLDEPTAALDPIAEYEVYSHLNQIVSNRTAIFISHRLSSCRFCDEIIVFDDGRLIQRGTHEQLLADEQGKYHELWCAQAQYYTEE